MADGADYVDRKKQRGLQDMSAWLQDGTSLHATRRASGEKTVNRSPQTSASAGFASATQLVHNLTVNGLSSEAQMRGSSCFIRKLKPSKLGCAIVEFESPSMREDVMNIAQQFPSENGVPRMVIRGVSVSLRRHVDKYNTTQRREVLTGIFISWSHCVEKQMPLPLTDLVDAFDMLVAQMKAPQPGDLPAPRF
eukprot:TRINITY_DN56313_c0_g1_i1.p1 TRINITY_DN56313_c0_g1~~TRINITY_DN56313_c0_g1_i1.p1  ORF type:complete len:193 (-),score=11.20 TRINITY_DN56313_c0_g1_i1:148-726(-)